MATAVGKGEGAAVTDPELWREQQRFYNFLQRYDLHKYHQRFLRMGVRRLTHFKDVTDADLDAVGLTPPEKARLRKKWDENFSTKGRIVKAITGKSKVFEDHNLDKNPLRVPPDPTHQEATIIDKEDIKMTKKLGEGAHGTVFEGTWSNKHGSVVVAVKTLYGTDEVHSTFIKEAQSMRALFHEHIVQLYGIVLSSPLMLIQELAPLGDLHTFLQKNGATKNLALFHAYAVQIADAMKYLEEKKIVHRDLATRNILLAEEDFVKLSDFGMARILDEQTGIYNLSNLQSRIPISWTALEALTHAKFSSASDVWSYAVTLWEIYSLGDIPWKGLNPIEIRNCLVRGERLGCPERCPNEIYQVMTASWEARPQDRPTFASIHERLVQRCQPVKARAVKVHTVAADEDNNCLSFNNGDLIYIINKPKQGWLYGMLSDGSIGYFLEDHVTTTSDPIGDSKGKAGKAKLKQLPSSEQASQESHWGKNGDKWGKTEEELRRSPLHSPPFRVVISPDHASSSPSRQRGRDGADFPRYAAHSPATSSEDSASPTPGGWGHVATATSNNRLVNDQYITMRRGFTMANVPDPEDREDYIDMQPSDYNRYRRSEVSNSMYENVGRSGIDIEDGDFYLVPRSRNEVPSSESGSSDGDSRPGSVNKNRKPLPPRGEKYNPTQRSMTLPSFSNNLPSQYSRATLNGSQEFLADTPTGAISPTNVKFLPTVLPSGASGSSGNHKSSSLEDMKTRGEGDEKGEEKAGAVGSPVKPVPRPRASRISPEKKSVSTDVPGPNFPTRTTRKSSLPDAHPPGADINNALFSEPLIKFKQTPQDTAGKREPLIPVDFEIPPLVPPPIGAPPSQPLVPIGAPPPPSQPLIPIGAPPSQPLVPIGAPPLKPLIPNEAPRLPHRTNLPDASPTHNNGEAPHTQPQAPVNKKTNNSPKPSPTKKPSPPKPAINQSLAEEFPEVPPEMFRVAARYKDMGRAREEVQVQILMGMNIPHTRAEDCRRALKHCQGKIDRAASWLVERNLDLEERSA